MEADSDLETMKIRDDLNRWMDSFEEEGGEVGVQGGDGEFFVNAFMIYDLAERLHEMSHNMEDEGASSGVHFASYIIADMLQAVMIRTTDSFDISFIIDEDGEEDE
jgi:hypothetical protein